MLVSFWNFFEKITDLNLRSNLLEGDVNHQVVIGGWRQTADKLSPGVGWLVCPKISINDHDFGLSVLVRGGL